MWDVTLQLTWRERLKSQASLEVKKEQEDAAIDDTPLNASNHLSNLKLESASSSNHQGDFNANSAQHELLPLPSGKFFSSFASTWIFFSLMLPSVSARHAINCHWIAAYFDSWQSNGIWCGRFYHPNRSPWCLCIDQFDCHRVSNVLSSKRES